MGDAVASRRLQGGSQALIGDNPTIVRVVPDVSGIDKLFDYVVPSKLEAVVRIGDRVRIDLNGRRVGGWVVDMGTYGTVGDASIPLERLSPLVAHSGSGVDARLVPVARRVARDYAGSLRSVLASASSPRVRSAHAAPRFGSLRDGPVMDVSRLVDRSPVVVTLPPAQSVVTLIASLAAQGPVLAVCPTYRMVRLGAAALRRRGLTTAELPDQWDLARAGVDVVIGTRGAIWAPVRSRVTVVVVDEHDEALTEERSPTWSARRVAMNRGEILGDRVVLVSPVPSLDAIASCSDHITGLATGTSWPTIVVEDLDELGVSGSLLGTHLLDAVTNKRSVACIINVKGGARLVQCKSCKALQKCPDCSSVMTLVAADEGEYLRCSACAADRGSVCVSCGRTSFSALRGGVVRWKEQIQRSTGVDVIEVTADDDNHESVGRVFVGTEALLHRLNHVDVVVFLDIDRELSVPRSTSERETLALVARAARLVGHSGTVVLQTRQPHHRLLESLATETLDTWMIEDIDRARRFGLPPYSSLARVKMDDADELSKACEVLGLSVAPENDDSFLLRADDSESLVHGLNELRRAFGTRIRIYVDPVRY